MTDGEQWTRDALAELRAARFSPRALVRFLGSSIAYGRERQRARPRAHRTTLLLAAAGFVAWGVVALSGRLQLGATGAVWWLLAALMLDWHLGMLDDVDKLGPANALSFLRAGMPPALVALLGTTAGVVLFAVAGASDVVDGRLARRGGEETRLGLWLDGSVDGLVLTAAALGALRADLLPAWAAGLAVARYILPWLVVGGAYFVRAEAPARAGFVSGRAPGLVLFAGFSLALLRAPGGAALVAAGAVGGLATFALTLLRSRAVSPVTP